MTINDQKRYEFITEQLRYVNEKIIEAFTLFVKLTTAIIAGIVWLLTQSLKDETRLLIGSFIPWLFLLLAATSILLIIINLRSWWGYRKAESTLVGVNKVPNPKFPRSCSGEIVMIGVIIVVFFVAWICNPLK